MSNIIKLKRGNRIPKASDLAEYELGYNTSDKKLYINDNGTIIKAGGGGGYIASTTAPTDLEMLWVDISGTNPIMKYYDINTNNWVNVGVAVFG